MRRLFVGGGIAVAVCCCGLLFSGAASARHAAGDTISVSGTASGTSIMFSGTGSPFKSISFSGGSNWHFTAISSSGGSCSLTPTNGGGFCAFSTPLTKLLINTTISGPLPTVVAGQVGYGDGTTGTFSAQVTEGATKCHCAKLSAEFTGFNKTKHNTVFGFFLKWKMNCTTGTAGGCVGQIKFEQAPKLPAGLALRVANRTWKHRGLTVACSPKPANTCPATATGKLLFEVVGLAGVRARKQVTFHATLSCESKKSEQAFTITFDKNGNLDRKKSNLGKLS